MKIENLDLANEIALEIKAIYHDINMLNKNPKIGVRLYLTNCPDSPQSAVAKSLESHILGISTLKESIILALRNRLDEHLKTIENL